jgi:uncharacterized membrane protein HdeD (DUF308 family)
MVVVRGVIAILFGVIAFVAPGISLAGLVLVWGAYAIVDGVFAIITAMRRREAGSAWGGLLFEGLIGIAAGVLTFFWPGITAIVLLYVIAFWGLFTGVLEIATAIRLRKIISGEWLLFLAGVASIAFGIFLIASPSKGALAVVLWIGAYALFFGILLVALGLRLRSWGTHAAPQAAAT